MAEPPDPIPLSGLQHWAYCPRQCGLIHLGPTYDDHLNTLRGQAVHPQTDDAGFELPRGLRVERALPVWSDALGLIANADVLELEPDSTPRAVECRHGSRHKAAAIAANDDGSQP
jgi:CRISPR-associated exonuclease Cas4